MAASGTYTARLGLPCSGPVQCLEGVSFYHWPLMLTLYLYRVVAKSHP